MLTVNEYAEQRGCSAKAVYNAIKKHSIPTKEGVSNGKAAQLLPDESVELLNQLIRTTPQELSVIKQQLEIRETDYRLALEANREAMATKDELAREKDITRSTVLSEIREIESRFTIDLGKIRKDYAQHLENKEKEIGELHKEKGALEDENRELKAKVKELTERLEWSQEHPFKNAWKYIGGQKNAPAEDNENASSQDS